MNPLYHLECGHGVAGKARSGKGIRTTLDKFGQGGSGLISNSPTELQILFFNDTAHAEVYV